MEPERWRQIERLYHAALEHEKSQRPRFLEQSCAGDESLQREVKSLLAQAEEGETFLEGPALEVAAKALAQDEVRAAEAGSQSDPLVGATILHYRILEKLGGGGMGEVWLAEQREPVRRRVALKLVKAGMNTREVMARFESERHALALMDHPAIAKVFDAGSTPQGAPYFVMEYVAGVPITAYCDNHKLSTRERLELFIHVCEGVQHAHPESHHPPRPETLQHPCYGGGRPPRAED